MQDGNATQSINLISPINQLGYGVAGIGILYGLSSKTNISLFPINPYNMDANIKYHPHIKQALSNANHFNIKSPCVRCYHQFSLAEFVGRGHHIGFPFFELNSFNPLEKHHINSVDKLFVSSNWAKQIIQNETDQKNISIVPLGVDREIFYDTPINNINTTSFCIIGKFEYRKGHDAVIKSFCKAFRQDDNVALWVMCDNPVTPTENEKWKQRFLNCALSNKIQFIGRSESQEGVANIMRTAHCGIFISRAEGWNLELLEMMSCGRQVITTEYSAHTEFCNNQNANLVQINNLEKANDGVYFHGFGEWAEISDKQIEQTAEYMRKIYEDRKNKNDIFNYHGVATAEQFSWENTAKKILNNIN